MPRQGGEAATADQKGKFEGRKEIITMVRSLSGVALRPTVEH